jgi:CheY-like chemotaxis protein
MAAILIVDDNKEHRDLLITLLGRAKHKVLQSSDGKEALNELKGQIATNSCLYLEFGVQYQIINTKLSGDSHDNSSFITFTRR